ncbi:hypothetical protein E2C01_034149 [Portunus trituberculatus]|uniref:Uncharacterized protein n=1 Tax=Portunus trituberculatus TaxID=210409 RepID=A0A5B7F4Z4_PORTR|nr:hypothetical protein [Portunus trituberculatus]
MEGDRQWEQTDKQINNQKPLLQTDSNFGIWPSSVTHAFSPNIVSDSYTYPDMHVSLVKSAHHNKETRRRGNDSLSPPRGEAKGVIAGALSL